MVTSHGSCVVVVFIEQCGRLLFFFGVFLPGLSWFYFSPSLFGTLFSYSVAESIALWQR